ncbi:MAG: LamG-like jellyroll fold domain-containing protein [Nitrospiria bacterium]
MHQRKNKLAKSNSAFTLLELLIVIAILAVLATIAIIVLNPAELIKQTNDSRRFADLSSIKKSLDLYILQNGSLPSTTLDPNKLYVSIPQTSCPSDVGVNWKCSTTPTLINGNGWIPVDFTKIAGGSTLSTLPLDPINNSTTYQFYYFVVSSDFKTYELMAAPESSINRLSGSQDKTSTDGGSNSVLYETGTNLTLSPISDSGLVGWWKLNDGNGNTVQDSSGNNHPGTLGGSSLPTWQAGASCKLSSCLSFNTNYVNVPNAGGFSVPNGHTIMAWFKPNALASNTNIIESLYLPYISFHASGNKAFHSAYINSTQINVEGSTLVSTGNWYHIAGTYDNTNEVVYLNGQADGNNSVSGTDAIHWIRMCIGAFPSGADNGSCDQGWANGVINDVRIYNRPLSPAEIKVIYNGMK